MPLEGQDHSNRYSNRSSARSSRPPPSRLENVRVGLNSQFSGRSRVGTVRSQTPQSPKTPRPALGLRELPSTRLHIPYLTRTNSSRTSRNNSISSVSRRSTQSPLTPISSRPLTPNSFRQQTQQHSRDPSATSIPPPVRRTSTRRFVGVDPAELHLAELAQAGRRRRKRKPRSLERRCAPKIKNRHIRMKILSCFISGLVNYPLSKVDSTLLIGPSSSHSY
jgi:hypothetical protein